MTKKDQRYFFLAILIHCLIFIIVSSDNLTDGFVKYVEMVRLFEAGKANSNRQWMSRNICQKY